MSDRLEEIRKAHEMGAAWRGHEDDCHKCWLIAEVERLRKEADHDVSQMTIKSLRDRLKERDAMLREFIALLEADHEERRECGCDWCAAVERARKMVGGR